MPFLKNMDTACVKNNTDINLRNAEILSEM